MWHNTANFDSNGDSDQNYGDSDQNYGDSDQNYAGLSINQNRTNLLL